MAEAVAAFYVVESAVEATAGLGLAVSGATVPLHALFKKAVGSQSSPAVSGGSAVIIKNKLYLIGGEQSGTETSQGVHVFSFPTADVSEAVKVDYEIQSPELVPEDRPLANHANQAEGQLELDKQASEHHVPWARTKHSVTSVNDKIYVLGGLSPDGSSSRSSNSGNLISFDSIASYDTLKQTYTIISADTSKCTEGLPEPRYSVSCTSSPNPPPVATLKGQGPSLEGHGTIFLHGGYDASSQPLHDTWTFDIGTRAWHKFPTVVKEAMRDHNSSGQIAYLEQRLWYINQSTVMYLELSEIDSSTVEDVIPTPAALSTGRVGSGQWQVVFPPIEADPAAFVKKSDSSGGEVREKNEVQAQLAYRPTEHVQHILPITTGAGRNYLVAFGEKNPQSMHLFQVPSSPKTATSIKDSMRDKAASVITSLPETWQSGKYKWSKVEVVQASKEAGEIDRPSEDLEDFATTVWDEYGDRLVLWGGRRGASAISPGWVINFD